MNWLEDDRFSKPVLTTKSVHKYFPSVDDLVILQQAQEQKILPPKKKKKEKGLEPLDISKQTSDTLEPFSGNSVKIWLPGIYSI